MFRRPRGRAPHGKKWDETVGAWVFDTAIRKSNSTIKEKKLVCDNCNKKFGNQAWLTRHVCQSDDATSTTSTAPLDIGTGYQSYTTPEKVDQRNIFALRCKLAAEERPDLEHILYLEAADGGATKVLIEHGFTVEYLHPCNFDASCLDKLRQMYPGIQCKQGDIIAVAEGHSWLGIWYDTTSSWCTRDAEWDPAKMPRMFNNAAVIAVNLCHRGITMNAENLAVKLCHLLNDHGGETRFQPFAYEGVGGIQNMAFGIATFSNVAPPKPMYTSSNQFMNSYLFTPRHYVFAPLYVPRDYFDVMAKENGWPSDWHTDYLKVSAASVDGLMYSKFVAIVSGITLDRRLLVTFYDKFGMPFEEPDEWWSPTPAEVEPFRADWFQSIRL